MEMSVLACAAHVSAIEAHEAGELAEVKAEENPKPPGKKRKKSTAPAQLAADEEKKQRKVTKQPATGTPTLRASRSQGVRASGIGQAAATQWNAYFWAPYKQPKGEIIYCKAALDAEPTHNASFASIDEAEVAAAGEKLADKFVVTAENHKMVWLDLRKKVKTLSAGTLIAPRDAKLNLDEDQYSNFTCPEWA